MFESSAEEEEEEVDGEEEDEDDEAEEGEDDEERGSGDAKHVEPQYAAALTKCDMHSYEQDEDDSEITVIGAKKHTVLKTDWRAHDAGNNHEAVHDAGNDVGSAGVTTEMSQSLSQPHRTNMAEYKMKYHENGLPKNWDDKDWDTYKHAMTNFFAEQDLLDTVEKKDQDAKKENKVRMYIDMSVPPSVAAQLREANTGSDMWETLCEVYETKKDAVLRAHKIRRLRSELENMSFRLGGDMNLHLSQMFNKKRELEQLGFKVHDIEMIDLMLKNAHVTGNRDYFVTFEEFSKGYDVTASGVFPDVKGRVEGIENLE
ncbi:hypothetical protein P43SY_004312 [Pythium insidiosum]|uniref:Uncharacterized protein n=1 Tax=Pythium insidiosum TaxID=114742 RepID=A0AAD5Q8D6_PYTIN|nr:hypothetical protein P43SY_004312 [Pythium insidiosum]